MNSLFMRQKFFPVVILLLFICLTPAEASEADSLLAAGQKAYREGSYKIAREFFNKAILISPDRPAPFVGSAKAWIGLGGRPQAICDLEEAIRLVPQEADSYCMRVYLLYLMGEKELSRRALDEAFRQFPDDPAIYYTKGLINAAEEDFTQAADDYSLALKFRTKRLSRKNASILTDFADSFGRPALDYKGAALYYARGMAYSQNGDFKAARRDFKRAARLNPSLRRYLPEDTSRVKTEEIEEI